MNDKYRYNFLLLSRLIISSKSKDFHKCILHLSESFTCEVESIHNMTEIQM